MANAHVKGSPFHLIVSPGETAGSSCTAFGEATIKATAGIGVSGRGQTVSVEAFTQSSGGASFTIVSKDKHHNFRGVGGDAFDVKLVPKSLRVQAGVDVSSEYYGVVEETVSRSEVGTVHDNNDGTYTVFYSSVKSG